MTSQKEISLLDLPCVPFESLAPGLWRLPVGCARTVQARLYGLGLCGRSARFTWAAGRA